MGRQKSAEAIVGHVSEGPNTIDTRNHLERSQEDMEQKTVQLTLAFSKESEAHTGEGGGTQSSVARAETRTLARSLMEAVVERQNMLRALRRVKGNKGSPGIDGMTVKELDKYLGAHWPEIKASLLEGNYCPQPIKRVDIPKPDGGVRQLGIPTVVDRLIQQAIHQILEPLYDPQFSTSSYGFRPGRSAHQALKAAREHVASGKGWVVDLDLEKFFDRVNHDILMGRLARRIGDKRLLKLIRRYLEAGVMSGGVVIERVEGTPQGGPLSPLLANILLDEFDKELERRGHAFCRYADDCNIYAGSRRSAERVMASLTQFLETRLKLRVNRTKSAVARPYERKFLGMRIVGAAKAHISVAPKSLLRFKANIRRITKRNRGVSLDQVIRELNQATMGWVNYFSLAQVKSICDHLDSWIRRRLRCFIWKQWKTYANRLHHLRKAGIGPWMAWGIVSGKHGPWNISGCPALTRAIPNEYLAKQGLQSLLERYLSLESS